ncbi:hypothetical protein JW905_00040 [bacterium]|nr:hypothetical protein [candidate division CSSED10-310 bacterium]
MKIERSFKSIDRYYFDVGHCSYSRGWAQVDTGQDAWYFGTWANPARRMIVNYCEGDITIKTAETDDEFCAALREIKEWNDEQGHGFKGIDPGFNVLLRELFVNLGLEDLLHRGGA